MTSRTHWADRVVAGIILPKERENARQELLDHMEDHMDSLLAAGFSQEEAERQAIAAMGDPEETAKLLRRAHQPVLTRLFQISRWMLLCALVIFAVSLLVRASTLTLDDFHLPGKTPTPSEELAPLFTPESLSDVYDGYDYLRLTEPGDRVRANGYTFTVTKAAISGHTQGSYSRYRYQIILCLEVTRDSRFVPWPELPGDWQMVTEDGSRSLSNEFDRTSETRILHGFHRNNREYLVRLGGWFPQDSRWVDLTYSNGESGFTLRVNLEGGTEYAR